MPWTQPADLRKQVQRLWDRGLVLENLLSDGSLFPVRLTLKTPTSKELSDNFDPVRKWIFSLQKMTGFRLEMKVIQHRILGENQVPASVWVDSFHDAVKILHVEKDVKIFSEQISLTKKNNLSLMPWLKKHNIKALQLAEHWPKLLAVIDWLKQNPRPGIYIRQVDISGIDTKFIENHRKILTTLLDLSLPEKAIDLEAAGARYFARRYGFLEKPTRVRLRILDPSIRVLPGTCQDITVSYEAFRCLDQNDEIKAKLKTLIITENEINFLAFPDRANSMVLFGAGYGFDFLTDVNWLAELTIHYWGDIDTHGFAILDQLRAKLPQTKSMLMDEETLLSHKTFWGQESKAEKRELTRLNREEKSLYEKLVHNKFSENLRLEQEKIAYAYLLRVLKQQN